MFVYKMNGVHLCVQIDSVSRYYKTSGHFLDKKKRNGETAEKEPYIYMSKFRMKGAMSLYIYVQI